MSTVDVGFNKALALRRAEQVRNDALKRKKFFADEWFAQQHAINSEINELNRRTGIGLKKFEDLKTALNQEEKGGLREDVVELFTRLGSPKGEELLAIYRKEKVDNKKTGATDLRETQSAVQESFLKYSKLRTAQLNKLYEQRAALETMESQNSNWTESPERLEVLKRLEEEYQRAQADVNRLQALGNASASVTRRNNRLLTEKPPLANASVLAVTRRNNRSLNERSAANSAILAASLKKRTNRALSLRTASAGAGLSPTFPPARNSIPSFIGRAGKIAPFRTRIGQRYISSAELVELDKDYPTLASQIRHRQSVGPLAINPLGGDDGKLAFPEFKNLKMLVDDDIYISFNPMQIFEYDALLVYTVLVSKSVTGEVFYTRAFDTTAHTAIIPGGIPFVMYNEWRPRSIGGVVEDINILDPEIVQISGGGPGRHTITHVLVKLPILVKFLSYKDENPDEKYTQDNNKLLAELIQHNSFGERYVTRYVESLRDEPVFQRRNMMDTVRIDSNYYMDVARLRIGSYEPVLEWLKPYAEYLICCIRVEESLMYVRFTELAEKDQRKYPILIDLRAALHYVKSPFIKSEELTPNMYIDAVKLMFRDWVQKKIKPVLLSDFRPHAVVLTSGRNVRMALRDKTLNAVGAFSASASASSSFPSESKGGEEYHASSAAFPSESKGDQEYYSSSAQGGDATFSMESKESSKFKSPSAAEYSSPPFSVSGPQGGLETVLGGAKSLWGGVTGAFSRGTQAVTGAAGTLKGTVSSLLQAPPLHEAYSQPSGPLGLPKRTRRTRPRTRRPRTRRRTQ